MAIPKFKNAGAAASGNGAVVAGAPNNLEKDDLLLLHLQCAGDDNPQSPPGWNLIDTIATGTSGPAQTQTALYWHRYDGVTPPDYNVPDAGNHVLAVVTAWRGVHPTENPIHAHSVSLDANNNTSVSADGLVTTKDGCAIVVTSTAGDQCAYSNWDNPDLSNPPIPPNEIVDEVTAAGNDGALHVAYGGKPFAGVVGQTTAVCSLSEKEAHIVVALNPKPFVCGELAPRTFDVRGFKIYYTDGTSYKSTSKTLPNMRSEWNAQTQGGVMLVVVRSEDRYGIYNKGGIHVERFFRELMPAAPAQSTDWRVWYDPPSRTFGAGTAAQMPSQGEWKDYTDSAFLAIDNSGNELDDVLQPHDAQLRSAYGLEQSEAGEDDHT